MRRILAGLFILAGPWLVLAAQRDSFETHDKAWLDEFIRAHIERTEAPPLAFVYDGKPFSASSTNWAVRSDERVDGAKTVKTVGYADRATGLRITMTYTLYQDFPSVEWVVRFKNEGASDTPILEDLQPCFVTFNDIPEGPVTLYRARGSNAQRSDFGPLQDVLDKTGEVRFGPSGGRSSDTTALPFFNIASAGRGIMAAVGWSGKWVATVKRREPRSITLEAGMEKTHFRLHPGEEVRTPSVALLFWKGDDRLAGHNLFRRFVLARHTPRPQGRPVDLPLSHGIGFGGPVPCNEYICATESYALAMIDRLRQFGIDPEAYWIDAGWYEAITRKWWQGVGNWTVNRTNFPADCGQSRMPQKPGAKVSSSGSSPRGFTRGRALTASILNG